MMFSVFTRLFSFFPRPSLLKKAVSNTIKSPRFFKVLYPRSLVLLLPVAFFLLSSCNRYYVEIRRQRINAGYLCSTVVNTPDPRRDDPPLGEMLVIQWQLPMEIMEKNPKIRLYAIYWDNEEKVYTWSIKKRKGYRTFSVLNEEFVSTGGLLTYRVEVITEDGEVYREWRHQMWVNLIKMD